MEYYSLTDIKKKNRSDVFHYIYQNPGSSKQNIAQSLNISLPTVTQHLTALMASGLIEKCGQLRSSIGRKATAYSAAATARISIGIEILRHTVYITALNLYGQKEAKEKIRLDFHADEFYFASLKDLVMEFLNKHEFLEDQILGIGIGIQGLVSQDGREVIYGKILDCTGLKISLFEKYFECPCLFVHDAECAANSELWENPSVTDCTYLSLGHHLGGAVILNGKLQRGLTGRSGTFEHMTLIPDGQTCYCGKKGCAECYCSASALLNVDGTEIELEEFFARKSQNDPICINRWTKYLSHLALLIHNLHMVMENTIILGGHITPYFTDEDVSRLRSMVFDLSTFQDDVAYILPGKCRNDAVSIGAAIPFIDEFMQSLAAEAE